MALAVREVRERLGWTQTRLAKESGVDRVALLQLELGQTNPTVRTLEKLADALGVEVADLFPKAEPALFAEPSRAADQVDRQLRVAGAATETLTERLEALARTLPNHGAGAAALALDLTASMGAVAGDLYKTAYRAEIGPLIAKLPPGERRERIERANEQLERLSEAVARVGDAARELAGEHVEAPERPVSFKLTA